jgi:hypothetical protein
MPISFYNLLFTRIYVAVNVVMCVKVNEEKLDVADEGLAPFFRIREVSGSNLGEETGYYD